MLIESREQMSKLTVPVTRLVELSATLDFTAGRKYDMTCKDDPSSTVAPPQTAQSAPPILQPSLAEALNNIGRQLSTLNIYETTSLYSTRSPFLYRTSTTSLSSFGHHPLAQHVCIRDRRHRLQEAHVQALQRGAPGPLWCVRRYWTCACILLRTNPWWSDKRSQLSTRSPLARTSPTPPPLACST